MKKKKEQIKSDWGEDIDLEIEEEVEENDTDRLIDRRKQKRQKRESPSIQNLAKSSEKEPLLPGKAEPKKPCCVCCSIL